MAVITELSRGICAFVDIAVSYFVDGNYKSCLK